MSLNLDIGLVKKQQFDLPGEWDEEIETFTTPGKNGWIIGWHPNTCNQFRIKVMRYHREGDLYPDIKREL